MKYEGRIYRMLREMNLSGRITDWLDQGKIKSNTHDPLNFVPSQSLSAESTAESSHSIEQYCLEYYILLNQIYSTGIIEMGLIKTFLCDRGKAVENAGRERILAEFLDALENQDACKEEATDPYGAISELEDGLLP